jgi:spore coat protein JC
MFIYQKKLQFPVNIKNTNPHLANIIITQYGGPDGELAASLRYLSQRFAMPYPELKALLTDIGTEELDHLEIIGTVVHQLTRNLTESQIEKSPFANYFVDHTTGIYPVSASGTPFTAAYLQSKGDVITDLTEDMAAEQKARTVYDNILRLSDDPDVNNVMRFLREREIVHFQRFGEGLRLTIDRLDQRNVYAFNPAFDKGGVSPQGTGNRRMDNRSNVSPATMDNKSNLSPAAMDNKTGISPMTMDNKSGTSPTAMDNKTGISPMITDNKTGVSPTAMDNKTGVSPGIMDQKTDISPETMDKKTDVRPMTMDNKTGISPTTIDKKTGTGPTRIDYRPMDKGSAGHAVREKYGTSPLVDERPMYRPMDRWMDK